MLYGHRELDDTVVNELKGNELEFPYPYFYVMLFTVEVGGNQDRDKNILQMIEEVLVDSACAQATWTGVNEISIIFNTDQNSEHQQMTELRRWSNRIQFVMKQYFNQNIVVYISKMQDHIANISLAYLQAYKAKSIGNHALGETTVFYSDTMKHSSQSDYLLIENTLQKFNEALQQNSKEKMLAEIEELSQYISNSVYVELNYIRVITSMLVTKFLIYLEHKQVNPRTFWDMEQSPIQYLNGFHRKQEFVAFFDQLVKKMDQILGDSEGNYIVTQAKEYIKQHYTENINMQKLAEDLYVSSNYLSSLFKKVTGQTLKDYMIHLRIEKAKHLLRNTNAQIAEIACETGYDNEQYFSRIFKKKTDMTPSQYRNFI